MTLPLRTSCANAISFPSSFLYSRISPAWPVVPMYRPIAWLSASKKSSGEAASSRTSCSTTQRKCARVECGAGAPPRIIWEVTLKRCVAALARVRREPRESPRTQSSTLVNPRTSSSACGRVRKRPIHCPAPMAPSEFRSLSESVKTSPTGWSSAGITATASSTSLAMSLPLACSPKIATARHTRGEGGVGRAFSVEEGGVGSRFEDGASMTECQHEVVVPHVPIERPSHPGEQCVDLFIVEIR
mmetsp:Transcript_10429/g.25108  ORF Transcript_10429/g.25108 Transcript_10429/m.25108 type:complete len:244 (+) Transcript_10429:578-1309(+)